MILIIALDALFGGKRMVNVLFTETFSDPKFNTATARLPFDALYTKAPNAVIVDEVNEISLKLV